MTKRKYSFTAVFRCWFTILSLFMLWGIGNAQDSLTKKEKQKAIMRDTLDGKLDFSRFLIDAKGFLPIPIIITEPALGNFGGVLALTFFTPKKAPPGKGYVPPDITAGFGMYTANNSWAVGGGRIGSIPKAGIRYRAFTGFASMNLDFFRDIPVVGNQKFTFNIQAVPILLNMSKELGNSDFYVGLQYVFANTTITPKFDNKFQELFPDSDMESKVGTLGLFLDWDKLDNFFTPNKGFRINTMYGINDEWTGSDHEFQKLSGFVNFFFAPNKNWVSGFRLDAQHVMDRPPFFLLPFLNMRGLPAAKYQGFTTALVETEQRIDFNRRWSAVAFGGLGKAINRNQSFADANWVYNYGTGFRYLIARAFGIRAGIDVAAGPDSFGWYIVFGHNWTR